MCLKNYLWDLQRVMNASHVIASGCAPITKLKTGCLSTGYRAMTGSILHSTYLRSIKVIML